ncbi:hypothetical protein F5Y05DRAFT_284236 [Hypoxylon sp. FL0543]|nr:hypothetical protein F5Y05DRAFT_284236 [Hypoxylon sp. FL0543]
MIHFLTASSVDLLSPVLLLPSFFLSSYLLARRSQFQKLHSKPEDHGYFVEIISPHRQWNCCSPLVPRSRCSTRFFEMAPLRHR